MYVTPSHPHHPNAIKHLAAMCSVGNVVSAEGLRAKEGSGVPKRSRGRSTPGGGVCICIAPRPTENSKMVYVAMTQCRNVLMSHHDMDTDSGGEVRQVRSCVDSGVGSAEAVSAVQNGEMGWV